MNYDKHEMKRIQFDENDVFTGNESGSVVEDGRIQSLEHQAGQV